MKGINIFISDKIRLHPMEFTSDGLGMATGPYIILDLDIANETLEGALLEALAHSKSSVPYRMLTKEEEKSYYRALGVKSHRNLGIGADVTMEDGIYTVTPVDKRGLFGKSIRVKKEGLLKAVKEALALNGVVVKGRISSL